MDAVEEFRRHGWGADAEWLAKLAHRFFRDAASQFSESTCLDVCARNSARLAASVVREGATIDRNRSLLRAFAVLTSCTQEPYSSWPPDQLRSVTTQCIEKWRQVTAAFKERRDSASVVDFEDALVRNGWPEVGSNATSLIFLLTELARERNDPAAVPGHQIHDVRLRLLMVLKFGAEIDLSRILDADLIASDGERRLGEAGPTYPTIGPGHTGAAGVGTPKEVRSLLVWTLAFGPSALGAFIGAFRGDTSSADRFARLAWGIRDVIERWTWCAHRNPWCFDSAGQLLAAAVRPYFDTIHSICSRGSSASSPQLRRAWLWFARCVFTADPEQWKTLPKADQDRITRAATEDLAKLRKILAAAAEQQFLEESDHAQTCLVLLYRCRGVWAGLKPMLLGWRALTVAGVAPDLRYWIEPDRELPPRHWSDLFAWPINLFHAFVGREQALDRNLERLRGELAAFCQERLVDRLDPAERTKARGIGRARTDDDMIERSPQWRYCLVRAFCTLGINPEAKAHRTLKMASEVDPDVAVRDAARQGYEQLRRNSGLPQDVSPRRAIMSALWWLRQAHLLGLGIQPDPNGAQRTRIKELARTKEVEQSDSLN